MRSSAETLRDYYTRGYRTWSRLCQKAAAHQGFPRDLVDFQRACRRHPFLHNQLVLKPGHTLLATGTSTWQVGDGNGDCDLPSFQQDYSVPVTTRHPVDISVEDSPEQFPTWFGDQGNHVCALTLAWAYVLSARWAEILPGGRAEIQYTNSCVAWEPSATTSAVSCGKAIPVDIGPAPDASARWWGAILAPNQGWTVCLRNNGDRHLAPWSTNLAPTDRPFVLVRKPILSEVRCCYAPVPSSILAACHISAYVAHHGVEDQNRAAFAAALMLPTARRVKGMVSLPAPRLPSPDSVSNRSSNQAGPMSMWGHNIHHLDKLLTLSCNNSIQSLLGSAMFEPGIPCNVYGAWIQGAFAALGWGHGKADIQVITGALMARNPKLGFLWLGAALVDMQGFVLNEMQTLSYPIDLTIAGWTGTLVSFIQEPGQDTAPDNESISRADECRLLFLTQSVNHESRPVIHCQPFGMTALSDCTAEVQEHARCGSRHQLSYSGWTWDCKSGPLACDHYPGSLMIPEERTPAPDDKEQKMLEEGQSEVDYSHMDCETDISRDLTDRMLMWLRGTNGSPVAERETQEHEWIGYSKASSDETRE